MATIRERPSRRYGRAFQVQVRRRGERPQTRSFRLKTDARKWANRIESAIDEGRSLPGVEARKHTVTELLDRYITETLPHLGTASASRQVAQLEWWKEELGHLFLSALTPAEITSARDKRVSKGCSNATSNRYLAPLSKACKTAIRLYQWMETNPVSMVERLPEPKGRVRYLTLTKPEEDTATSTSELQRLRKACRASRNPFLETIVVLAISTGGRQGELLGLTWDHVDLERGRLTFEKTKNGERRSVPLQGDALDLMHEHRRVHRRVDTSLVFPNRRGNGPLNIRNAWEQAVRIAEIEDFRFHDLRHTAASYLAMNGASALDIAAVLGHKTLAMTKRYAHLSDSHLSSVVGRMNSNIDWGSSAG